MIGGGVIALLVWAVPALIGAATAAKVPLWVYVGVGLISLVALSVIIRRWRRIAWGGLRRGLRWLWSWHPVSSRRLDRATAHAARQRHGLETLHNNLAEAQQGASVSLALTVTDLTSRLEALEQKSRSLDASIWGMQAGAAPATMGAIPLPQPRWTIKQELWDKSEYDFTLTNHVPRSVAREVRVEGVDNGRYSPITILGAGHFEDLSGENSGAFRARFDPDARSDGASFTISWYDEAGEQRWEQLFVPGWVARPAHQQPTYNDETPF